MVGILKAEKPMKNVLEAFLMKNVLEAFLKPPSCHMPAYIAKDHATLACGLPVGGCPDGPKVWNYHLKIIRAKTLGD